MHARKASWLLLFWLVGLQHSDATADPSVVNIRWTHANPSEVIRFEIVFRSRRDARETQIVSDVGLPGADGVYSWPLTLLEGESIWLAVRAVDAHGLPSELSNWRRFDWKPAGARATPQAEPAREAPP